jgi:L-ascorbate metabolism protein UlaG (beta-lactamase superfamily)
MMAKMKRALGIVMAVGLTVAGVSAGQGQPAGEGEKRFAMDTITTKAGELKITFIGHATLMFDYGGKVVHVDPWTRLADYAKLPKADLVLITHEHADHLDPKAVSAVRGENTKVVLTKACADKVPGGIVMKNGDVQMVQGFKVEAVPAYNVAQKRPDGQPYHPRGVGNGYIVTFGETRVYVAGDTENTPEMAKLEKIDIAFLPMNLPYTMTPAMVAEAAKAFKPKILYPYHYGETDPNELVNLLKDPKNIEVRIRKMQ